MQSKKVFLVTEDRKHHFHFWISVQAIAIASQTKLVLRKACMRNVILEMLLFYKKNIDGVEVEVAVKEGQCNINF